MITGGKLDVMSSTDTFLFRSCPCNEECRGVRIGVGYGILHNYKYGPYKLNHRYLYRLLIAFYEE